MEKYDEWEKPAAAVSPLPPIIHETFIAQRGDENRKPRLLQIDPIETLAWAICNSTAMASVQANERSVRLRYQLAQFEKLRQTSRQQRHTVMSSTRDLLNSIRPSEAGLTLAELLTEHPQIARRTAQRQIATLIAGGQVVAQGEGRARRYIVAKQTEPMASLR